MCNISNKCDKCLLNYRSLLSGPFFSGHSVERQNFQFHTCKKLTSTNSHILLQYFIINFLCLYIYKNSTATTAK